MHVLGLRLKKEEFHILFEEYDVDGNGTIDLVRSLGSAFRNSPPAMSCEVRAQSCSLFVCTRFELRCLCHAPAFNQNCADEY
jgi:hypothetical protein